MLLQEELQSERQGGSNCGCLLPAPIIQTHTRTHSDLAQLSMPRDALSHATIYVCVLVCTVLTVWIKYSVKV